MSSNKKALIVIIIIGIILLAGLSIFITINLNNNQTAQNTDAQVINGLNNCNSQTQSCTITEGVCNPSKAYVHTCSEIKNSGEKCIDKNPIPINGNLTAGAVINMSDYTASATCGTVQIYLELASSGATSLGACGTLMKTFGQACTSEPVSFPTSFTTIPISAPIIPINPTPSGSLGQPQVPTPQPQPQSPTGAVVNPNFSILKQAAPSCDSNGDGLIQYTISVSNISTVVGTVNFVKDTLDTGVVNIGVIPAGISNSGIFSNGSIMWTGTTQDRSFIAGQTKQYSYSLRIPKNKLGQFTSGINNEALVQYDTTTVAGNTATFNLKTTLTCTIQTLPTTGVLDDLRFLIMGFILIILGYISYRYEFGKTYSVNLLNNFKNNIRISKFTFKRKVKQMMPFEEGLAKDLEEKIEKD